jgi:oligoendopeptidase F
MEITADIRKTPREFLPENFVITSWEALEPFFQNLLNREISSGEDLEKWMKDSSELEAVISEDACWRQIRMTCDTENKALEEAFTFFVMEIQPKIQPYADQLNRKLIESPFSKGLDQKQYFTYLRGVKKSIDLFREENIPLQAELSVMAQQYGVISGKMSITVDGKEYTLQQASKFLENPDRAVRESVYLKIQERRYLDRDQLNELYTTLIQKRHQVALNAGFANYRDYKFAEMGRFDYTKEDTFAFHDAVKQHVVPLVAEIYEKKKQQLGLTDFRPWDTEAEPAGVTPLRPFQTGEELLEKTIECFRELRPFFADCLVTMKKMGRLDLESRKGKAPGGYNCPLAETGAPFIFMNAAGQMHDVTTMVHEGGHAIHSFLAHPLRLNAFKDYPMEIAEVASMSMELFSMDFWHSFFSTEEELVRAKEHQLERVITIFPWIAIVDKFQHWVYENPTHTLEERATQWVKINDEFSTGVLNLAGLEEFRKYGWQRQLHLYEVPFYYIEYGIAQLGAIGMWKQFKEDKEKALDNYTNALALGGTRTLPELYLAAGISFDLGPTRVKTLMDFVGNEMKKGS